MMIREQEAAAEELDEESKDFYSSESDKTEQDD